MYCICSYNDSTVTSYYGGQPRLIDVVRHRNCDCCIRMFYKYFILLLLYSLTEALVRLEDSLEQSISALVFLSLEMLIIFMLL